MSQLYYSAKLFIFGAFCDLCASFCTALTEKCILKNKPLNKKLLTKMSNFCNNCYVRWQRFERWFLDEYGTQPNIP